ncbi:MAG: hypothetical protein KG028_15780 [Actinobacteria bacterium]|nr:hypothetical protein [Actinomycetota bacterium]
MDDELTTRLASSPPLVANYLILAGGRSAPRLARHFALPVDQRRVAVDGEYRTALHGVYAIGRLTRPDRSQAIISAGAGAVAALDIFCREAGHHIHDWDAPTEHDHDHPNL